MFFYKIFFIKHNFIKQLYFLSKMNGDLIPVGSSINFKPPSFKTTQADVNVALKTALNTISPSRCCRNSCSCSRSPPVAKAAPSPVAKAVPPVAKAVPAPVAETDAEFRESIRQIFDKHRKAPAEKDPPKRKPVDLAERKSKKRRTVPPQEIIDGGVDLGTLLKTASKMHKEENEKIHALTAELESAKKRCQEAVVKSEELQTMNDKLTKELFQWRLLGDKPPDYIVLE